VGPLIIALTIVLHLALPLFLLLWVGFGHSQSRLRWSTDVLLTAALLGMLHVAGAGWAMLGSWWRTALWAGFVLALLASLRRVRRFGWLPARWGGWLGWLVSALGLLSLTSSLVELSTAHAHREQHVDLTFPLHGGTFYVVQGGSSALVNAHHAVAAQRYALDIVKTLDWGGRAHGLAPVERASYAAWEQRVLAPCAGEVLAVRDDLDDLPLGHSDLSNPAGNHVVLHCTGVTILLAHLRRGSVTVRAGTVVVGGQQLAAIGNSGNTTEPHLHMHAVRGRQDAFETVAWSGRAVPMHFAGRFLVRNDVVHQ